METHRFVAILAGVLGLIFMPAIAKAASCTPISVTQYVQPTFSTYSGATVGDQIPQFTVLSATSVSRYGTAICQPAADGGVMVTTSTISLASAPYGIYSSNVNLTYQQKTISSAPATIYNTNLSGVGVAVMAFTDSSQVFTDLTSTISSKSQSPAISAGQQQSMSMTFSYILLFVKTGPVAGGTVPTSALPKVNGSFGLSFCADGPACGVMTDVSTVQVGALNAGSGQIPFTVPTCQIDDVTVQMGTHDLSELPGKGQPLSSSTSFNLNLHDCSILNGVGGLYDFSSLQPSYSDGYNAIYYTITPVYGADDVYGAAGVMKLDAAAGSATGIGIQLSGNQTFSTATSFGSLNTAAAQLRKLSPGYAVTPMLYARYFQTSDAPTPGSANSKATITLSYR